MFKLVVLSVLLAVAVAHPGHIHSSPLVYSSPIVEEHSFAKVGAIVKSVPIGETHHSSSIVHNTAHHVEPIVAPVVRSYAAAPIVKAIHTPLVRTYAPEPWTVAAPARYGYDFPIDFHSAPLSYAAGW